MTPSSEIAKMILIDWEKALLQECANPQLPKLQKFIAEVIDQARTEAVIEDRNKRCTDDLYKHCYERGRKDALFLATKIVSGWPGPGGIILVDGDVRDPVSLSNGLRKGIVQRLRNEVNE